MSDFTSIQGNHFPSLLDASLSDWLWASAKHQSAGAPAACDRVLHAVSRRTEAAAFAKASSDMKTNLAAMGKAIAAIEKGASKGTK